MTEKRFFKIMYDYDWWFVFDKKQEYVETECPVPHKKASDLIPMEEEQVVELLNENEQLKHKNENLIKISAMTQVQNDKLKEENEQLKQENQRMTDKLNQLALEFLNYDMVTMGKATEMSEMSYYDFLKYRKENGNPMELKE